MKVGKRTGMSTAERKEKQCTGKAQIKSISEAQGIIRRAKLEGVKLYWYECDFCNFIHMTSRP